jgi:DNA-binding transcriptional regulator YiaG
MEQQSHSMDINPSDSLNSNVSYLLQIARSHLSDPYLKATKEFLQNRWGLLEYLAPQLFEVFKKQPIDRQQTLQQIQDWLGEVFEQNDLWNPLSEEVWVNVLAWTVQDLDTTIAESIIQNLAQEPFRMEVWGGLFHPDLLEIQNLLQMLKVRLADDLREQILAAIATDTGIEIPVLRISSVLAIDIEATKIEASDTPLGPISHSEPESLSSEAWIADPLPELEAPLHLEHILTREGDLRRLPWELLTALKQQGALALVQLQFLLAAHATRQPHPQNSFTLKASDLLEQLDWQSEQDAPFNLIHNFEQIGTLEVTSLWMTDAYATQVEAFNLSGHPWDILTDLRGNLDWNSGRIAHPEQVYFTIRPGLWMVHILQNGGLETQKAFQGFGQFALTLLKLDYCRNPFLLSLIVHLAFSTSFELHEIKPSVYKVIDLIEVVFGPSFLPSLQMPQKARSLLEWWNQALEALLVLGWRADPTKDFPKPHPMDFYVRPCPEWLSPTSHSRKPQNWVQQWLAQSLCLQSPQSLAHPLTPSPSKANLDDSTALRDRTIRRLRFDRLTGSEIRAARKAKRLTQSQLAEALHVHQSLVAKIEAGRRSVTEDLERSLRQVLEL